MKILALEFSSRDRSVAVVEAQPGGPVQVRGSGIEPSKSGTSPLCLVQSVMEKAGVSRREIDRVSVGLGPGSYTGIRSALALAQGWQLATGVGVVGISSVDCLAAQAQKASCLGIVTFAIDAQRKEVYLAEYAIRPQEIKLLVALHLAPIDRATRAQILVGPEADRWHPNGQVLWPSAEVLAELSIEGAPTENAEMLEPIYLRETEFVKAPPARIRSESRER